MGKTATTSNKIPQWERVLAGSDPNQVFPGDFILAHRKGLVSKLIRMGERLRFRSGARWSHAMYVEGDGDCYVIEALTHGVRRTPLSTYRNVEYVIVHTGLSVSDTPQATAFARSCIGQHYGWGTILGIALRFLTPGRGLWFGANGTEICSGLVAQCMVRGWANFTVNPATMTPAELAEAYNVPKR